EIPGGLAETVRAFIQFAVAREIEPMSLQLAKTRFQGRSARLLCALVTFGSSLIALGHSVAHPVKHHTPLDRCEPNTNRTGTSTSLPGYSVSRIAPCAQDLVAVCGNLESASTHAPK